MSKIMAHLQSGASFKGIFAEVRVLWIQGLLVSLLRYLAEFTKAEGDTGPAQSNSQTDDANSNLEQIFDPHVAAMLGAMQSIIWAKSKMNQFQMLLTK